MEPQESANSPHLSPKQTILPTVSSHHRDKNRILLGNSSKSPRTDPAIQGSVSIVLYHSNYVGVRKGSSGSVMSKLPIIMEEDEDSLYVQKSLNDCYNRIQLLRDDAIYLENLLLPAKPKRRLKRSADCIFDQTRYHFSYLRSFGHLSDSAFAYHHKSQLSDTGPYQLYRQFSSFSSSHMNRMISYLQIRLRAIRETFASAVNTSLSKEQQTLASIVLEQISQVSACISRIWRLYLSRTEDSDAGLFESDEESDLPMFPKAKSEGNNGGEAESKREEWISL